MGIEQEGTPLVSICCTTYNLEQVVGQALDGFVTQKTDFPFEIIVHDDASKDRTQEIVMKYADRFPGRIKTVFQDQNQFTRKDTRIGKIFKDFLFPVASGKYIAMCDGDDYWTDPNKLQLQIRYMRRNPDTSGCFTNSLVVNEMDNTTRKYHADMEPGSVPVKNVMLKGGWTYPTSTLLFDKKQLYSSSVYKDSDKFNAHIAGDTILIFALCEVGSIGFIDEVTAVYRRWKSGDFSSIKDDKSKLAKRLQQQLKGFKILTEHIKPELRSLLNRKISLTSYHIIRYRRDFKRFKYLHNLGYREFGKLVTGKHFL